MFATRRAHNERMNFRKIDCGANDTYFERLIETWKDLENIAIQNLKYDFIHLQHCLFCNITVDICTNVDDSMFFCIQKN